MQFHIIPKLILLFCVSLFAACASVQEAPKDQDMQAKQFIAKADVAQVYVYRHQTFGAALSMPIAVNGKLAGNTGPKSYFKFDLPAGKHIISSQGDKSTLEVDVETGKIYYVWQQVKMGMVSGGSELQLMDAKEAQEAIAKCKLIASELEY